jgi:metallo-beta-lactamase class B
MSKLKLCFSACLMLSAMPSLLIAADAQESAQVTKHLEAAKELAKGSDWSEAANLFCMSGKEARANGIRLGGILNGAVVEPTKVFDNLYFVGQDKTLTWVITTPAGIILLDSNFVGRTDDAVIDGLKKLNLKPEDVKLILLGHGHADVYGGARYFQDHYGTHVVVSAADWDYIAGQPVCNKDCPGGEGGAPLELRPKRDLVATEGKPITLGGESLIPVSMPGHTPGTLAYIFPVYDHGKRHMAAILGSFIWGAGDVNNVAHVAEFTQKMHVDVEIADHATWDGMAAKLAKLKDRKAGDPNPFVIGEESYQRMLKIAGECAQANVARAAAPN